MNSSVSLFFFSLVSFLLHVTMAYNYSQSCHSNELSALIELKKSFLIYPNDKLASWKLHQDCCFWDGLECDEDTGHVIGLDLTNSSLYGSFHPNSTLFDLVHLQTLNLAHNDFNYSHIPISFRRLSMLAHLNLSNSSFTGHIPYEISGLAKLASLDLSFNPDLKLRSLSLHSLVGNMSRLQQLYLNQVKVGSQVPPMLANMSSLTSLLLEGCELQGEFPSGMFQLPNLRILSLRFNTELRGTLPDDISSPLEVLRLAETSFSGEVPASIGDKATSLYKLDLQSCRFSGRVPSSISNLTRLTLLYLGNNTFHTLLPTACLSNLTQLQSLILSPSDYKGENLNWVAKLTHLSYLRLIGANFSGQIPSSFQNLTKLVVIDLSFNQLTGEIPSYFANLTKLSNLILSHNRFNTGKITWSFSNRIKLRHLELSSCNLSTFPYFLTNQNQLELLDLSHNNIQGLIPSWIFNASKDNLLDIDLSHNYLTGFEEPLVSFPLPRLLVLDLSFNMIQKSLPLPPLSARVFSVSNNSFTGNISPLLCNLTFLEVLDFSFNNLSGTIPSCFSTLAGSLSVLNLQNNNLQGIIPPTIWTRGCKLKMINLSKNKFEGMLPTSMVNCEELESIDLSDNMMKGTFPQWLGSLSILKILILRSNQFHGTIGTNFTFRSVNIFDISHNSFTGVLPSKVFESLGAKANVNASQLSQYMHLTYTTTRLSWSSDFDVYYSMRMNNKATMAWYQKILESLIAIDVSSNGFEGEIPKSIGDIRNLYLLNLSSNALGGSIPPFLSNLTRLEVLDLSHNKLSGEIPNQLGKLSFLAFFDVSCNHLMGQIPQGTQFDTFSSSWFEGNAGLCGSQLEKKCGSDVPLLSSPSTNNEEDKESFDILWVVVALGYASGLVIGLISGNAMSSKIQYWISRTCGVNMIRKGKQPKGNKKKRLTQSLNRYLVL